MPDITVAPLPEAPAFTLTSTTIEHGAPLALPQLSGLVGVPGGGDVSPHLRWEGAPEATRSYAVTMFDPDAPTGSGFWHWAIIDLPASVTELAEDTGNGAALPAPALTLPNDARAPRFIGAAPPAGHGSHRYVFTVHALDLETLSISADATPAYLGFSMLGHTLARATLVAVAETPAA